MEEVVLLSVFWLFLSDWSTDFSQWYLQRAIWKTVISWMLRPWMDYHPLIGCWPEKCSSDFIILITSHPDGLSQCQWRKCDSAQQARVHFGDLCGADPPGGFPHPHNSVWQRHGCHGGDHQQSSESAPELVFGLSGVCRHSGRHLGDAVLSGQWADGLLVLWHRVVRDLLGVGCALLHLLHCAPVRHQPGQVLVRLTSHRVQPEEDAAED